jgi:uncharacterized protein HemX
MENESANSIYAVWVAAIAAIGGVVGVVVNIIIKRNDSNRDIKIEEIKQNALNLEQKVKLNIEKIATNEQLIGELKKTIHEQEQGLADMVRRYYAISVSFRLLLKQFGFKYEGDKETMQLLELFDRIVNENKIT